MLEEFIGKHTLDIMRTSRSRYITLSMSGHITFFDDVISLMGFLMVAVITSKYMQKLVWNKK